MKHVKACPGFGHVHTPGIGKTDLGRNITIAFDTPSSIVVTGTSSCLRKMKVQN